MRCQEAGMSSVPLQVVEFPPVALLTGAVIIGSALIAVATLTVGVSLWEAWRRRRQKAIRAELTSELLEALFGRDDPEWEQWVGSLSARQRRELEPVLDSYLRSLDGSDRTKLAKVGPVLGINDRSRRHLHGGSYWRRLHALTWLTLLRDPPDRDLLRTYCTHTPRERATAARILYASETSDCSTTGTDLLLADNPSAFSVFGVDTLYRVSEGNPSPLFERAATDYDEWSPALTQQVLLVTRHLNTVVGSADLSWITKSLSSKTERVRVAAYRALDAYGWNSDIRTHVDVQAISEEPSPAVRASAYRMLGAWGDGAAISELRLAAAVESDPRARVVAVKALYPHDHHTLADVPPELADAWAWAAEHARLDAIARDISSRRSHQ